MHWSVVSFWGWLVILHMLCLHIHSRETWVFAGMFAGDANKFWFTDALEASLGMFTASPSILTWATCTECDTAAAELSCIAVGTRTAETHTNICTCSSILTWVGFTVVSIDFTEVASKTRRAQTGSMGCKAIVINACSSILAGRTRTDNRHRDKIEVQWKKLLGNTLYNKKSQFSLEEPIPNANPPKSVKLNQEWVCSTALSIQIIVSSADPSSRISTPVYKFNPKSCEGILNYFKHLFKLSFALFLYAWSYLAVQLFTQDRTKTWAAWLLPFYQSIPKIIYILYWQSKTLPEQLDVKLIVFTLPLWWFHDTKNLDANRYFPINCCSAKIFDRYNYNKTYQRREF